MNATSLRELFVEELKDLYDAENQLIEALPKMAEASMSADLRNAFEEHLQQTACRRDDGLRSSRRRGAFCGSCTRHEHPALQERGCDRSKREV